MGIREMVLDKAKKEGKQEGIEIANTAVIQSLWKTGNFTISQIAVLVKVSEAFVQSIITAK